MIRIENFSKNYKDKQVFKNFNLTINDGEITAVLGASGSGKTTLLFAIANLINYNGQITGAPEKKAYIFQEDRLIENLTVEQNIKLVGGENYEKIINLVELANEKDEYIRRLSGGMKRRVSLARAMYYNAPLLLMDEPFSALDFGLKIRLINAFKKYRENTNATCVIVTHGIDEALLIADRIIVIDKSQILFDYQRKNGDEQALRKQLTDIMSSI